MAIGFNLEHARKINEINQQLSVKADISHNHNELYSNISHNHNDRYSNIVHDHNDRYANKKEFENIKEQISQNKPIVINNDTPIGTIVFRDKDATTPFGWLVCDGRELSIIEYADLFNSIGYKHGGTGGKFKLPKIIGNNIVIDTDDNNVISSNLIIGQIAIIKTNNLSQDILSISQEVEQAKASSRTLLEAMNKKFDKTGGTIEGTVLVPSISSTEGVSLSLLSKTGTMYIKPTKNSDTYGLVLGGGTGALAPIVDNELNLGDTSKRYKDIYISSYSKTTIGYTKLPNGMILQWGYSGFEQDSHNRNVKFAITFPTICVSVVLTLEGSASQNPRDCMFSTGQVSTRDFWAYYNKPRSEYQGFHWMAMGY